MSSPEIRDVMRRLALAERALSQRPIISQQATSVVWSAQIIDGNVLDSGQDGVLRVTWTLDEPFDYVQADLEINDGELLPDGVCRAFLYKDGRQVFAGALPRIILIGNDSRSGVPFALAEGEWIKVNPTQALIGYYGFDPDILIYGHLPEFR